MRRGFPPTLLLLDIKFARDILKSVFIFWADIEGDSTFTQAYKHCASPTSSLKTFVKDNATTRTRKSAEIKLTHFSVSFSLNCDNSSITLWLKTTKGWSSFSTALALFAGNNWQTSAAFLIYFKQSELICSHTKHIGLILELATLWDPNKMKDCVKKTQELRTSLCLTWTHWLQDYHP